MNTTTPDRPAAPCLSTSAPLSGKAIASLVCSICGFFVPVVLPIAAVVLARLARRDIDAAQGALGGRYVAMTGQIVGWIGVGLSICLTIWFLATFVFVDHTINAGIDAALPMAWNAT